MADPSVQQRLACHQFEDPGVDLSRVRRSAHGEFVYNLQLVLVHSDGESTCEKVGCKPLETPRFGSVARRAI